MDLACRWWQVGRAATRPMAARPPLLPMHRAAAVKRRDSGGEKDFGKGGGGLDFLARLEEVERKDGDAPSAVEPVRHQWPGPAAAYLRAPAKNVPAPKDVDHVMEQLQRMEQELASKKNELRNKRESTPPEKHVTGGIPPLYL